VRHLAWGNQTQTTTRVFPEWARSLQTRESNATRLNLDLNLEMVSDLNEVLMDSIQLAKPQP
jgi:hypothetical protein